jgi:GNAT superfamily N-acetyltransferase
VNIAPHIPAIWTPCRSPVELTNEERRALAFLLPLSEDYPGIDRWFALKVVPGLRYGTRHLLPIEREGELVGLGIAKNEPGERKICTVRVAPSHAGLGIGVRLFDGLLKWLDDDRPHLTVTQSRLPAFERIFDYYGFTVTSAQKGVYVPHAIELGYNEPVPTNIDICKFNGWSGSTCLSAGRQA